MRVQRILLMGILLPFLTLPAQAADGKAAFADVSAAHGSYDAISYMKDRQIMSGYPDGTFKPDRKVNRAEALKIIVGQFMTEADLKKYSKSNFADVKADAWYVPYVEWAHAKGNIINGPPKTLAFYGERPVTKVEFLKMFLSARDIDTRAFGDISIGLSSDVRTNKDWFYPYLRYAIATSMTTANQQRVYSPNRELTREDVAILLYRFFQYRLGQRTQALLTETKTEIERMLSFLSQEEIREAEFASARALLTARGAHEMRPEEKVVKVAVKTAESCRALVRAYRASMNNNLEEVIKLSGDAWFLADQARKIDPESTALAQQLQKYAKSFADQAREASPSKK